MDCNGGEGTSPICLESMHTFIHALNLCSEFNFVSMSAMIVVEKIQSLASVFKTGLPQKAVLKLKLRWKLKKEGYKVGSSQGGKCAWGRPPRELTEPKVKKQLEFCKE